ncbi:hypothetical protein PCANC_00449 [Puccinia coronata f. sp. avenae]|uniref:Uncharacterized protein n=1 Tax=Puccinia coronata f. sp. avenae TaxID=200324 RepID=A0A2N5T6Q8_9BASI|nr:hypothetical protein PCANC_05456 [Puccinia coronata f. sp. avenae]PLW45094.1 hypothetical protein PCASD_04603 [Puccinia coronata f. sp. avenae]PLW58356.1 hypothetical protein PCANC_00449 [Puccinia coronata f. sp. avenae]
MQAIDRITEGVVPQVELVAKVVGEGSHSTLLEIEIVVQDPESVVQRIGDRVCWFIPKLARSLGAELHALSGAFVTVLDCWKTILEALVDLDIGCVTWSGRAVLGKLVLDDGLPQALKDFEIGQS